MAAWTGQVAASTDDARSIAGGGSYTTTATSQFLGKYSDGNDYWNGFRWLNVAIPQGMTISSATLDLYSSQQTGGTTAKTIWHAEAADNPATFSTSRKPNGLTLTTASDAADLLISNFTGLGFGVQPFNVTNSVQEIINRPGWVSGNALVLIGHDNGSAASNYVGMSTYDRATTRGATLTINYVSGPTPPSGLTATESSGKAALAWTDNSSDETGFEIQRRRGGSPNFYTIASVAAGTTSYTDSGVSPGYTYTYQVRAVNASGQSAWAVSSALTMSGTKAWTAHAQAWIYPGETDAQVDLTDGRFMYSAKPEYGTLSNTGVYSEPTGLVNQINDPTMTTNARTHSLNPYFTVSSQAAGVSALGANSTLQTNCINGIVATLNNTGFAGVELDWEGFGTWTATDYTNYKAFVANLCTAVHAIGKKVIICGPPIADVTQQGYYQWKYEDFESSAVDFIEPLAYDLNFDNGAGTPIAPTSWVQNVCAWTRAKISNVNRIIIGMPSYGYYGTTGAYDIVNITKTQAAARTGYPGTRDSSSQEMTFASGGVSTFYNDGTGLNSKREIIEDEGIQYVSVWHLGDNDWFSGKAELDKATGATNLFFF